MVMDTLNPNYNRDRKEIQRSTTGEILRFAQNDNPELAPGNYVGIERPPSTARTWPVTKGA
jgi:hypothetical protein